MTSAQGPAAPPAREPARASEDVVALAIGLLVFILGLGSFFGADLLGWVVTTSVWTSLANALAPVSRNFSGLGGAGALLATFAALLVLLGGGARALGIALSQFLPRFAVVFAIAYACWIAGSQAHMAAVTPADLKKFGIDWSLKLTAEGGYIVALVAGLIIANGLPRFADWLADAVLPELYVKVAIVILGAFLAVTAAEKIGLASTLLLRGVAAIVEAYLIYWAVVYYIARKWFRFNPEWAAPLASGISICGVSAAIATGSAIRARPAVPIIVSSVVVVFAVVEVLILPFLAQTFLAHEPLVAGAWLGLAVKTDGAAIGSGSIAEALIVAQNAAEGVQYQPGWILGTTAAVKVFIDIFIGIWAFVLAWVWTHHINAKPGDQARAIEIWQRFPKFILGFVATFALTALLAWLRPSGIAALKAATVEANTFRVIFFLLTFFSIGLQSNFSRLWQEGFGRLVAVYVLCLFGFVIWVGLLISWIFFAGVKPPLAGA